MSPFAVAFLLLNAIALLALPRRWAVMPIVAGACYITRAQNVEIGPFSFTVVRLLVAVGMIRLVARREWLGGGVSRVDVLIAAWGVWMLGSGTFHSDPTGQLIYRLGLVFDGWGLYFLLRTICHSIRDVVGAIVMIALVLVPIGAEMVVEKATARNLFSVFGGVSSTPSIRDGRVRAQGPFGHSILAGNIGAVCLPFMLGIWYVRRRAAIVGTIACVAMVYASTSSGPIMTAAAGIGALFLWRMRCRMRLVCAAAIILYLALDVSMRQPGYFLIARIDLTGGSTGWHRARLIQSAFQHLSEWWFAGTDYTRHWMASGVAWSADHTDITNHYLKMGVLGGLPLMALFIGILLSAFKAVGRSMREPGASMKDQWLRWACGAALFAHAVTCLSVSYFDQSIVFLYLTLAAVLGVSQPCTESTAIAAASLMPRHGVASPALPPQLTAARWRRPGRAATLARRYQ